MCKENIFDLSEISVSELENQIDNFIKEIENGQIKNS